MKKTTKSFAEKIGLVKPECERTKTQKIVRDVAFFAVVIYAAVISFLYFDLIFWRRSSNYWTRLW